LRFEWDRSGRNDTSELIKLTGRIDDIDQLSHLCHE
jgi:hypothetical protein